MTHNCRKRNGLIFQKQRKNRKTNALLAVATLIILLLSGLLNGMLAISGANPASQPLEEKSANTIFTIPTIAKIDDKSTSIESSKENNYESISPQTAQTMINEDQDIVVIDVRTAEEYAAGHIEKALLIPFSGCDACFIYKTEAYQSKSIIVYGEDDEQSKAVCYLLVDSAFKQVYQLEGGLQNWQNNGFPVVKEKSSTNAGKDSENSTNVYALGYVPPEKEVKYTVFPAPLDSPPLAWDWRSASYNGTSGDWTTPVKNQWSCGSCWDFAAIGALEAIINIKNNDPAIDLDLSEQYILSCNNYNMNCVQGGSAYQAYEFLANNGGAIPESCFSYQGIDANGCKKLYDCGYPPVLCSQKDPNWNNSLIPISEYGIFHPYGDRNLIKNKLIEYGPLVAVMEVYSNFFSYNGGIYYGPAGSQYQGSHQVVIVGYNDTNQYWICKNSWGTGWGINGYFKIAYGVCQIESEMTYVTYNLTGPETYITDGPSGTINYNDVTFAWNGSVTPPEDLVYSYLLEGYDNSWSSWSSAKTISYYDLADGNYTFKVRAKDEQGNYDLTPATRSFTVEINPPLLDQSQIQYDNSNSIWSARWSAQSFTTLKNTLTMVELYIGKSGNPSTNLTISLRSSLTGPDLISVAKPSSQILTNMHWAEFDFSDYSLTPGSTYYLVVRTSGGSATKNYVWGYGYNNPYINGSFWMSNNSGSSWTGYPTWDFCFKTYSGTQPPPNTPSTPSGPSNLIVNTEGYFTTSATDPDGDQVQYMFDWDAGGSHLYSDWTGLMNSGTIGGMYNSWNTIGTYVVKARARDSNGAMSGWSTGHTVVVSEAANNNPNTPTIPSGPVSRMIGESGTYSTSATDPDGDMVQYRFDWNSSGAHNYSGWTSLVPSGQSASLSHSWSSAGTYVVRAQARDEHGSVSINWSAGLTVNVVTGTEVIDQQQTHYDKSNTVFSNRWSAQSFKPTLGVLTKVTLYVGKTGSPSSDLVVSIRSSRTGPDLVSVSKPSGSIPSSISWVEFDLPDYTVTPGSTYYLVVRTSGGSATNNYLWAYGYYNPYTNGSFWMSTNAGSSWTEYATYDFCFKTYGM